jgi:hypothetical protein
MCLACSEVHHHNIIPLLEYWDGGTSPSPNIGLLAARMAGAQWPENISLRFFWASEWPPKSMRPFHQPELVLGGRHFIFRVSLLRMRRFLYPSGSTGTGVADSSNEADHICTGSSLSASCAHANRFRVCQNGWCSVVPLLVPVSQGGALQGPQEVQQVFFNLQLGNRSEAVSVDRLQPHPGWASLVPASPAL